MPLVSINKAKLTEYVSKLNENSNQVAMLTEVLTDTKEAAANLEEFHTSFGLSCGELQTNRDNRIVQHTSNTRDVLIVQSESLASALGNIAILADRAETEAYRLLGGDVSGQTLDLMSKINKTDRDANISLDACKTYQDYVKALNNGSATPASVAKYLAAKGVGRTTTSSIIQAYLKGKKLPDGQTQKQYLDACLAQYDEQKEACKASMAVGSSGARSGGTRGINVPKAFTDANGINYNTNFKKYMCYDTLSPTSAQGHIVYDLANKSDESGVLYVDTEVNGTTQKAYCAALPGSVLSTATGSARCGDVFKVTWEDGSTDYLISSDSKGDNPNTSDYYGHDPVKYPHCVEFVTTFTSGYDPAASTEEAHKFASDGVLGAFDISSKYENLNRWNQTIASIEYTGTNVLEQDGTISKWYN